MNVLKTHLTEGQFRDRLGRLCKPMKGLGRDLSKCEAFVYEEKQGRFWLGAHHGAKSKNPGLSADRIEGRFCAETDGTVTVSYRFGRHPAWLCLYIALLIWGIALAVSVALDWTAGESGILSDGMVSLFLLVFGTVGLCGKASERRALEAHLRYVCEVDAPTEESLTTETLHGAEPQLLDVKEVYPLRLVFGGREYLTLYGYAEDGDSAEMLHAAGNLLCFRDPAQIRRFCDRYGLEPAEETETLKFDSPATELSSPSLILNRWNRLSLMAEALGQPFAGDEEIHAPLRELLFTRALPASDDGDIPLEEAQLSEARQVLADAERLFAGFRFWSE